MKLLIVESPSKAKTIEKYLDGEYKVVASVGHVRDLPKSNKSAIDIKNGFKPNYVISPGKEHIVEEISRLAKKSKEVLLATDPDREGEAIAWHVAETAKLKKPARVLFYEITPQAIKEAIQHPRPLDVNLRKAQEARRVLDRLVGYDLSGLIWKKLRYGLSAGRVQSPALHILVEREKEIRAFVPDVFFVFTALFHTNKRVALTLTHTTETKPKTEEAAAQKFAEQLIERAKKAEWSITEVKETPAKRSPYPPFTTSTLQQAASSRLGFAPSRTMKVAQKLYEAGHITYMRTDSTHLSKEAVGTILGLVQKQYGEKYVQPRVFKTKSKNAQEAHEAIRPTHLDTKVYGRTDEEKRLYTLIRSRAISSQMADAELLRTKISAEASDKTLPLFSTTGSIVVFPGWLAEDAAARGDDTELPKVTVGESLSLDDIQSEEKWTEPPKRYTEAGLVKELEKRGIGRPSTYAAIIQTIQARGYVEKDGRALIPTDTGEVVDDFLVEHFERFVSDTFTAEMEDELDEIAEGKREYEKTLKDFYGPFTKEVKSKEKLEKMSNLGPAPAEMKCPVCGGKMIIKLGRSGKFYSCSKFPKCTGALTLDGKEVEGPKSTGEICPECGKGELVERSGRFGSFIACNNYPKCKYVKKDENAPQVTTGVKCPVCNKGEMAERRGRYGIFYSCSNYPTCKNAIKAKPTGSLCTYKREDRGGKECGALMMEGTKTIPERCSDKTCPNHNPHKLAK
ncbi:MAG: type I DNA topoisomerase [Candidatus Moraniibacteriota bacterium]|nr:MAG: type I DNA topoisomerase [Candidatus Moranbacteria bacterium]